MAESQQSEPKRGKLREKSPAKLWEETKEIKIPPEMYARASKYFQDIVARLIKAEPFYAHFLQLMQRHFQPLSLPDGTRAHAGVTISGGSAHIVVDPELFPQLSEIEATAVLKHEVFHIILDHISRGKKLNHMLYNIASDIAINQMIEGLPKWTCDYKKFKLPPKLIAEVYYELLLQNSKVKFCIAKSSEGNALDTHGAWKDSDKGTIAKEVVKNMVAQAYAKSRGLVPAGLEVTVKELLESGKLPWYMILRMFCGTAQKVVTGLTWKKENRRFSDMPAKRKSPKLHLALVIDTSASVSDEELNLFFNEIDDINKNPMTTMTLIECDAQVAHVQEYRGKRPKFAYGRGGTAFQPGLDHCYKMRSPPDGIIYFTDGENFGEEVIQRKPIPVLWVLTPNGESDEKFGKKIKLPKLRDRGY